MGESKVSLIVLVAVGIIFGLVVFQSIAGYVSVVDDTLTFSNTTYTAPAAGSYTDVSGCQEIIGDYIITNATSGAIVVNANVSLVERVGTDGLKSVSIYTTNASWSSKSINASYTCGIDGYVEDSGSRGIIALIVIVSALAIAVFAMIPSLRDGVMDYVKG